MKTVLLYLPDALADDLQRNSALHGYEDVSRYVADALQARRTDEAEHLRELLLEGLQSGGPMPATTEFWAEIQRETDEMMAESNALKAPAA